MTQPSEDIFNQHGPYNHLTPPFLRIEGSAPTEMPRALEHIKNLGEAPSLSLAHVTSLLVPLVSGAWYSWYYGVVCAGRSDRDSRWHCSLASTYEISGQ